ELRIFWLARSETKEKATDKRCAFDKVPVERIHRNRANSHQKLIIRRRRLFDVLKFEIRYAVIAIDNGFHRIGWSHSVAPAVVSRRPIGDKAPQDHQHKNRKQTPFNQALPSLP